jgi:hypothetical protein
MGVGPSSCMGRRRAKEQVYIPKYDGILKRQIQAVPAFHRVNLVMIEPLQAGRWIPDPAPDTKLSDREQQLVTQICGV